MVRGKVAVISGSASDKHVVVEVTGILDKFGVEYDARVISAHRNREMLGDYVKASDADVFVAVAGLAAHLPGVIASMTVKPVIGVPVGVKMGGLDSLLSIVQMPPGVPVAAVGIDNGRNAGLLAVEFLSLKDESLAKKLVDYRAEWRKP